MLAENKTETEPVTVYTLKAKNQEIADKRSFIGILRSENKTFVYPQVTGFVHSLHLKEGDYVKKGQLLLKVVPDRLGREYKAVKIFASQSGYVSDLGTENGRRVSESDLIFCINDPTKGKVTIDVTHADLATFSVGRTIELTLISKKDQISMKAKVAAISRQADDITGTFQVEVKAALDNTWQRMIGLPIRITDKRDLRQAVLLPLTSIYENRSKIILVDEGKKAKWSKVKLGKIFGESVEVLSGVKQDDIVVTSFSRRPEEGEALILSSLDAELKKLKEGENSKPASTKTSKSGV